MNNVKRYSYGYTDDGNGIRHLGLIEKPEGQLVRASDYDALRAEYLEAVDVVEAQTKTIGGLHAELKSLKAQEPVAFKGEYEGQDGEKVVFYSDSINDFRKNPPDFGELQSLYASPVVTEGEYDDAYQGAREDLAIWKRRALEAEELLRRKDQIIDHLTMEAQGEIRLGEPHILTDNTINNK